MKLVTALVMLLSMTVGCGDDDSQPEADCLPGYAMMPNGDCLNTEDGRRLCNIYCEHTYACNDVWSLSGCSNNCWNWLTQLNAGNDCATAYAELAYCGSYLRTCTGPDDSCCEACDEEEMAFNDCVSN